MTVTDVRTEDRYPTRTTTEPTPFERLDPTVWSAARDEKLEAHDTNGFHTVDGLLSDDEVHGYRDELDRLVRDRRVRADERTIIEPKSDEVRSIFEVHKISSRIAELVRDPRLLDRARRILGSEVYVHQSRINYMPGFKGNGFYWHSDFETWHAEDGMPAPRAVSCSIALTDNYPFNGGLMIIPGAHRTFVPCLGETPDDNYTSSLKEQKIGVPSETEITKLAYQYGIEQFTGEAGSALWFDSNCLHGSGNNITPFPRSNIFVVFNSVENALTEPFAARKPRPEYIASRDFTPVTR